MHQNNKNINKIRGVLQNYSSKDLVRKIGSIYRDARNYDEHFNFFQIFKVKPTLSPISLFANPFYHDPNLSNEENILNLMAVFKIHDDFLRNYLNVLYGDEEEGEAFAGRSFELISADYKKVKDAIEDILKIIPNSASENMVKSFERKRRIVEKTIEKYPATLYRATKELLLHFESSASRTTVPKLGRP